MKKKIIAGMVSFFAAACMTVTAFAESFDRSITFTVDEVPVTGTLSVYNSGDYNPFAGDSARATTEASSKMKLLSAQAILYYAWGDKIDTAEDYVSKPNVSKVSAYAAVGFELYVGYQAKGTYYAQGSNYGYDTKSNTVNW